MLGDDPLRARAVMMPPGGVAFWVHASPRLARGRRSTRSHTHAARRLHHLLGKVLPAALFIAGSIGYLCTWRKASARGAREVERSFTGAGAAWEAAACAGRWPAAAGRPASWRARCG